jgi:hypothetical protein
MFRDFWVTGYETPCSIKRELLESKASDFPLRSFDPKKEDF